MGFDHMTIVSGNEVGLIFALLVERPVLLVERREKLSHLLTSKMVGLKMMPFNYYIIFAPYLCMSYKIELKTNVCV